MKFEDYKRKCRLLDGRILDYDACTSDLSDPGVYKGKYDYFGTGYIHSINGVSQADSTLCWFYTLIKEEKTTTKHEFKVGDEVEIVGHKHSSLKEGDVRIITRIVGYVPYPFYLESSCGKTTAASRNQIKLATPKTQRFTNHSAYIDAMKATIKKYGEAIGEGDEYFFGAVACALCHVSGSDGHDHEDCVECPHLKITGMFCTKQDSKNYAQRILDLQDWIRQYEEDAKLPAKQEEKVWEPEVGDRIWNETDNCSGVVVLMRPEYNPKDGGRFMDRANGAVIKVDGGYDGCYPGHRWVLIDECTPVGETK